MEGGNQGSGGNKGEQIDMECTFMVENTECVSNPSGEGKDKQLINENRQPNQKEKVGDLT